MSTTTATNNGQFAKGTSGNPSGRPLGSRNRATLLMRALLEGVAAELIRKTIERAKEGNIQALGICMDRLLPLGRDQLVDFPLPPIENLADISSGMASILAAVSQGQITPMEGDTLSRILERQTNVIVTQDLERRVDDLELGSRKTKTVRSTKRRKTPTIDETEPFDPERVL